MPTRYAISPIIGDGSGVSNPFRSAIGAEVGEDGAYIDKIKGDPQPGAPIWDFAFTKILVQGSLAQVLQVSNAYVFPEFPLDSQMAAMESTVRNGLIQSVQAYNLDGDGTHIDATHDDADSYRDLIDKIGKQWSPEFDVDFFEPN